MKLNRKIFLLSAATFSLLLASCGTAGGSVPPSSSSVPSISSSVTPSVEPSTSTSVKPSITNPATLTVINGSGSGVYEVGSQVTVTADVKQGLTFKQWESNGVKMSTNNPYTFTIYGDKTLTAVYSGQTYTIEVINGSGSGTYDMGAQVTVTANEIYGKEFVEWQSNGTTVSYQNPYTFSATKDITLTAIFQASSDFSKYVKKVYKDSDKDFKVLNLTDIQMHDGEVLQPALDIIDELVTKEQPDMITFLGDLLNDNKTYNSSVNSQAIINKIDSYKIPWAPIFGNHDYEDYQAGYESAKKVTSAQLAAMYTNAKYCLFTRGPDPSEFRSEDKLGQGNYVVNVIDNTSKKPVRSLIFLDSRLGGLSDQQVSFYEAAVNYTKEQNGGTLVPSNLLTHVPLFDYGEAYSESIASEYHNVVGSINRDPCDLATGTKLIFPKIKELGSTQSVICGHDHENCYYTYYQGIRLAYAMKSSQGDKHYNVANTGGCVLSFNNETDDIRYVKAKSPYTLTGTESSKAELVLKPDTLSYWRYSGAKLNMELTLPSSGSLKFNIEGTNLLRTSVEVSKRYGAWNRLTNNVTINAGDKTASKGSLSLIQDNLYKYTVDVTELELNKGSGEVAIGDETARIVYINGVDCTVTVNDMYYTYENVIETNQKDLANAKVSAIADQFYRSGVPVKPIPTVTLDSTTLETVDDILVTYENNTEVGKGKAIIVPSGKGAHNYKGQKVVEFNIVVNPDDDTKPGHENACLVDATGGIENANFGNISEVNWYNSNKKLHLEVKKLQHATYSTDYVDGFSLHGYNTNPGTVEKPGSKWNRLTAVYKIDFSDNTVKVYKSGTSTNIATVVDLTDGWFSVEIHLNDFELNSGEGALGNENETLALMNITSITRSFKLDKVSLISIS